MSNGVGIDLGADTIRVATIDDGIIAREPSLLAVDKTSARILALGQETGEVVRINPNAILMRPFSRGFLARKNITRYVLNEVSSAMTFGMTAAVAVPCNYSASDAEQLFALMREGGFAGGRLVYSPIAAKLGCNISPDVDCLFVNVGCVVTDILLSLDGRIAYMESMPMAGAQLDRGILDFMAREKGIRITPSAAEQLKKRIGTAWTDGEDMSVNVSGESLNSGAEQVVTVSATELMAAFEETVTILVEHICGALRRVPLNRVESMFKNGIYLVGGGASLLGLDRLIGALTGVHTTLVPQASDVVALGLSRVSALSRDLPAEAALLSRVAPYTYEPG